MSGLANSTTYFWRANASNANPSPSIWSGVWSFTTIIAVPPAPILSLPTNNALNQPTSLTFTWGAATGAATYSLHISDSSTFSDTVVIQTGIAGIAFPLSGLNSITKYYWRVNATNVNGTSPWSAGWSFTTTLDKPTLLSPSNALSPAQQSSVTMNWNPVSGATSYTMQISTALTFATTVRNQTGLTGTNTSVDSLPSGTIYYWRANGSNPGGAGTWSSVWSFSTDYGAPLLVAPRNDSLVGNPNTTSITLTWASQYAATGYLVQVATSSTFLNLVYTQSPNLTSQTIPAGTLIGAARYYWRVNATGAFGGRDWSSIWSFTTSTSSMSTDPGTSIKPSFSVANGSLLFSIPRDAAVEISFYTIDGRTSLTINHNQSAGSHRVALSGINLVPGEYIVRLKAGDFEKKIAMIYRP